MKRSFFISPDLQTPIKRNVTAIETDEVGTLGRVGTLGVFESLTDAAQAVANFNL